MAGFTAYKLTIEVAVAIDASSAPTSIGVNAAGLSEAIRNALIDTSTSISRQVKNAVVATPTVTIGSPNTVEVSA
jgi:hypothetical protein